MIRDKVFRELVLEHHDALLRVAYSIVGPNDCEDVLQTALLKAYQNFSFFRFGSQLKTWIHRIVVNTALDYIRKKSRAPYQIEDSDIIPSEPSAHLLENRDLIEALGKLKAQDRLLVTLHYFEGMTLKEISRVLDVKVGTLKSRLFSIKEKIRDIMNREEA